MTPTTTRHRPCALRRNAAVLGLITALGTSALVPLTGAASARESGPTVATQTASAQQGARQPQLLRVVSARTAPRARVAPPAPAAAPVSEAGAYQQRLLELVNVERGKRGLHPLAMATCGDGYADRWADSMAQRNVMEHQQLRPILSACQAHAVAENVAFGSVTADRMMEMWMASPGHRTNILRPEMTHIGIGSAKRADGRVYGCQVFLDLS